MHVNGKYLNRSNAETGSILQKEATCYYGIECMSLNEALENILNIWHLSLFIILSIGDDLFFPSFILNICQVIN